MYHYSVYINASGETLGLVADSVVVNSSNNELIYEFIRNDAMVAQFRVGSVLGWKCLGPTA